MKKYTNLLFIISILFILIGLITGKITTQSFSYISIPGSLIAIIQILFIVLILSIGLAILVPAFIIDLLLLVVTGMDFPLINSIWYTLWDKATIQWFWIDTPGSSIFFGSVIISVIAFFFLRRR